MKLRKKTLLSTLLILAMLLSLAACGSSSQSSAAPAEPAKEEKAEAASEETKEEAGEPAEELTAEAAAAATAAEETGAETAAAAGETGAEAATTAEAAAEGAVVYDNNGFHLTVPAEYDGLLFTTTPEEDGSGTLFMCSEIASIEAANALGSDDDHAGRLFSIRMIDKASLHEKLCYDMSGEDVFATDGNGTYFLLCHPTDVSLVRESYEDIDEDLEQWGRLQEWAATVPDTFIQENEGLTAAKYGNSNIDMHFAQIAYMDGVNYTISTTEFGPLDPMDVDPVPYLEKLWKDVSFEYVDEEAPDGEYVVLDFPEEETRFDFFLSEGKGNYIRQVNGDDMEYAPLFKAVYADGSVTASQIMQEWYSALAEANGRK